MLPSAESTVPVVPGCLASRLGALNAALIVACSVSVAPDPPLLLSRNSRYPVPGTAARKKLNGLEIIGWSALTTGAVSDGTANGLRFTAVAAEDVGFGSPKTENVGVPLAG